MMDSRTTRPCPEVSAGRAARRAALPRLLACLFPLALLSCYGELESANPLEQRIHSANVGYELIVRSPRYNGSYPDPEPIPIRVTIRNTSKTPQVLDLSKDPRRGQCALAWQMKLPPQRDPVELFFAGRAAKGGEYKPFLWRAAAPQFPRRLELPPGASRVLFDTTFVRPKELAGITGHFCIRAYAWEVNAAVGTRERPR